MANRLWANNHWEVVTDGVSSLGSVEYFIPRERLCEVWHGRKGQRVAMWPMQVADKSWAEIEPFLEAFDHALTLLQPRNIEAIDVELSRSLARDRALRSGPFRRYTSPLTAE